MVTGVQTCALPIFLDFCLVLQPVVFQGFQLGGDLGAFALTLRGRCAVGKRIKRSHLLVQRRGAGLQAFHLALYLLNGLLDRLLAGGQGCALLGTLAPVIGARSPCRGALLAGRAAAVLGSSLRTWAITAGRIRALGPGLSGCGA